MIWFARFAKVATAQALIVVIMPLSGCRARKNDPEAEAPPPTQVGLEGVGLIQVDHPEYFPLVQATAYVAKVQTTAVGRVVSNDPLSVAHVSSGANRERSTDFGSTWIACDIYRSDIVGVKVRAAVEIRANNKAARTFTGHVAAISFAPGTSDARAKVWISTSAPELLPGAFVIAAFPAYRSQVHAAVPESAVLNYRDRHWVYVPAGENVFRRVEVVSGSVLSHEMKEIVDGIKPAESVVQNPRELLKSSEP